MTVTDASRCGAGAKDDGEARATTTTLRTSRATKKSIVTPERATKTPFRESLTPPHRLRANPQTSPARSLPRNASAVSRMDLTSFAAALDGGGVASRALSNGESPKPSKSNASTHAHRSAPVRAFDALDAERHRPLQPRLEGFVPRGRRRAPPRRLRRQIVQRVVRRVRRLRATSTVRWTVRCVGHDIFVVRVFPRVCRLRSIAFDRGVDALEETHETVDEVLEVFHLPAEPFVLARRLDGVAAQSVRLVAKRANHAGGGSALVGGAVEGAVEVVGGARGGGERELVEAGERVQVRDARVPRTGRSATGRVAATRGRNRGEGGGGELVGRGVVGAGRRGAALLRAAEFLELRGKLRARSRGRQRLRVDGSNATSGLGTRDRTPDVPYADRSRA